ncbi:putative protein kinase [Cavenderia fasciculata]|uniref:Uncharacterized protein n=1 Tax=Cavenderia fasciculata TaxID=261658 RepID=F4QCM6_CACFS|nr:putative protein kinase [Cavenderia fasciculata]EGG14454.1 putative protein kinase [Cavenderia fasciculata]|eukprot:XP_004353863.1 putative protein kinase [Cavenderia fasciculata]
MNNNTTTSKRKIRSVTAYKQSKFDVEELLVSLDKLLNEAPPAATSTAAAALTSRGKSGLSLQQCCQKFTAEGFNILQKLREKTKTFDTSDVSYFILRGGITILIKCLCFCGRTTLSNEIALEISQYLIDNNHQTARLFCKQIINHLCDDIECVGVSETLPNLISLYPIRSIFIEDLCIPKLIEIYYKGSIKLANGLINNQQPAMIQIDKVIDKPLETPKEGWANLLVNSKVKSNAVTCLSNSSLNRNNNNNNNNNASEQMKRSNLRDSGVLSPLETASNGSSPNESPTISSANSSFSNLKNLLPNLNNLNINNSHASLPTSPPQVPSLKLSALKPIIPKLNLPIRIESSAKMTRSSRRREDNNSSTRSTTGEVKLLDSSSTKELSDIATKLGETFVTADLTALISYKQAVDAHISQTNSIKRASYAPKKLVYDQLIGQTQHLLSQNNSIDMQQFRSSNIYKVRSSILKTLIAATSHNLWLLQYVNNPMNLIYSEVLLMYKGMIPYDFDYLNLVFQFAYNWADYVEYIHRIRWNDVTKGMTPERKGAYRKKLDVLLWRFNYNILNIFETNVIDDLEHQLHMLADYMEHCPTRIMPSQVVDVCIEVLLKIKHYWFKGRISHDRYKDIHVIHYLLCVFDEIITQNMHPPLNDLLLAIFIEREDTFNFIKHYTQLLTSSEWLEKEFERDKTKGGSIKLIEYRCRVFKHHSVCVDMIKRSIQVDSRGETEKTEPDQVHISELVQKMEYLLLPGNGVILPFLQSGSFYQNYLVKKQMMEFLCTIFYFKKNPYTKKKIYIDSYISFIKLYNNYTVDPQTLTLCKLFLNILIAFSINKNDKISLKFYQLRTMDFMVREVNLEYEVKQNRNQLAESFFIKKEGSNNSPLLSNNTSNNMIIKPLVSLTPNDSSSTSSTTSSEIKKPGLPLLKLPPKVPNLTNLPSKDGSNTTSTPTTISPPKIPTLNIPPKDGNNAQSGTTPPKIPTLNIPPKDGSSPTLSITPPKIPSLNIPPKVPSLPNLPTKDGTNSPISMGIPKIPALNIPPKDLPGGSSGTTPPKIPTLNIPPKTADGAPSIKPVLPLLALPPRTTKSEVPSLPSEQNPAPGGFLSAIEQKIDLHDPKFQLVFGDAASSNTLGGGGAVDQPEPTDKEIKNENQRYQLERANRKLYHDKELHISILQLIFSLLLNPNQTLEHYYSDQYPILAKKLNVPFILQSHINHTQNEHIIPELCEKTLEMGPNHYRILKLLFNRLFHASPFKDLKRVAKGAFGTVYKGYVAHDEGLEVAVKLMPVPKSIHDRCVLHDIFTEILIMDTFRSDHRACHMFDYGVDGENYWIAMKSYKCSLKEWRLKQTGTFLQNLPLYLNIYMNVLLTVQFLAENKINHFDIKCDNFLVHPIKKGTLEEDFWNQPTSDPNFIVCLADWGEAKVYIHDIDGYTTRNRGTEFIKSPEMLMIAFASQKTRENFDRRKKVGSNTTSDVWSLGCLFYELLTGDFLFYDDDWVKFFIRVTQPGQELITPDKKAKISNMSAICDFLDFIFVRDPFYRPTLRDLLTKFAVAKPLILAELGQIKMKLSQDDLLNIEQPKQYFSGGDGTRYKGPSKISGHYTPGRFFPHSYNLNNPTGLLSNKNAKASQQTLSDDSLANEQPEFPEHKYLMEYPSKITSFMYISSYQPSMNRNLLKNNYHITHIINCTGSPNAFPDHFEYLHLQLHDDESQDILHSLTSAFDFIRDAIVHQGRVLIVSDKGISRSAALAIGYFMDSRSISYFEAFILIRDCRYIINPNLGFVEQLCRWGKQRRTQKGLAEWGGGIEAQFANTNNTTTQFQCLCGACVFTLLAPFDSTKFKNPRNCNCSKDQSQDCPNLLGCSSFLHDMKKLHNYSSSSNHVIWGYTNITNVVGDYKRSSVEIQYPKSPPTNSINNGSINRKDWTLYKCKTCHFLTYAINNNQNNNNQFTDKTVAIVTNIRSDRLTVKR